MNAQPHPVVGCVYGVDLSELANDPGEHASNDIPASPAACVPPAQALS
jgi:hypothetical protein